MSATPLSPMLLDVLHRLMSANSVQERSLAEQQLQALKVVEEYGVVLTELLLDPHQELSLRQMTSVLLKQYVEQHWCADADKFQAPLVPQEAKQAIRRMLPQGLKESISKIRSTVAYTIAAIGHWDWPDHWPELFDLMMSALQDPDEFAVQGAVRVLKEFARDLSFGQVVQVAPVILPEVYRIFCEPDKYSVRTRSRAVGIFSTMAEEIAAMAEEDPTVTKDLLKPLLPTFTRALVEALHVPDESHVTDAGLKTEVLQALTLLVKVQPKAMSPWLAQILPPVWNTLTSSAQKYVAEVVNQAEDDDEEAVDSDGEVLGFESLVFAIFEFVHVLVESPKFRKAAKECLTDLMYYIVIYMQITERQCEKWADNPEQFVEDEDEDSFSFSVRLSSQDLIKNLCQEFEEECCVSLAQTLERHVLEAEQAKVSGQPNWWKIHEAAMLALGSQKEVIERQIKEGNVKFDLGLFLNNIVVQDIANPASPYLLGRCLWLGSKFTAQLSDSVLPSFVEATVRGLQEDQLDVVRISAVRAIWGLCQHLSKDEQQHRRRELLNPFLPAVLDAIISMCTKFNAVTEVLGLLLENMSPVLTSDQDFTASQEARVTPLIMAIFLKYNHDPLILTLTQDIVTILAANPGCLLPMQQRLVPTLVGILEGHQGAIGDQAITSSLQTGALDILCTLVRANKQPPLNEMLVSAAFPATIQLTLKSDDHSVIQSGGECLRAFASVSPQQVCMFTDSEGKTGLWYLVQVTQQLLNPTSSESTALFAGKLVTTLIQKAGEHLGQDLDLLLKAVLSKLLGAETLSVVQSLILVYAHLIHTQLEAVLHFLTSVPGPSGESALHFVLNKWVSQQHVFFGAYETKVCLTALVKLLNHGVNTNDVRLQTIMVKGDQIVAVGRPTVRTRAQKRVAPDTFTEIPVLTKIFKLAVNELTSLLYLGGMGPTDDHLDSEDDSDEGEDDMAVAGEPLSSVLDDEDDYWDRMDAGNDADDDDKANPLYSLKLKDYLLSFVTEFCKQPYFPHFAKDLSEVESKSLISLSLIAANGQKAE